MEKDFEYQQMLAGELYLAGGILPEHKSVHGKKIAQQINQTPIADKAKLKALVKQLFGKGNIPCIQPGDLQKRFDQPLHSRQCRF